MAINNIEFVFLLAGKSTRNYPHSKGLPHKALMPFGSHKIIDYHIKQVVDAGGKNITFVVRDKGVIKYFKECFSEEKDIEKKLIKKGSTLSLKLLKDVYLPADVDIKYVIQRKPRGIAHALGLASKVAHGEAMCMILPDDIVINKNGENLIKRIVNQYEKQKAGNLFLTMEVEDPSRWGIIENGLFLEKPVATTSHEAFKFAAIFDKEVVKKMEAAADRLEKGEKVGGLIDGKELHFADFLNESVKANPAKMSIATIPMHKNDMYLDCGSIEGYEKAILYSLIKLSAFAKENKEFVAKFLV